MAIFNLLEFLLVEAIKYPAIHCLTSCKTQFEAYSHTKSISELVTIDKIVEMIWSEDEGVLFVMCVIAGRNNYGPTT